MKYGYENVEKEELIQNYETLDNKIVITFLDGSNHEVLLTKENEIYLLNKMLEQALDRSKSSALCNAKQERKKALKWIAVGIVYTLLDVVFYYNLSDLRTFYCILAGIAIFLLVVESFEYKFKNDEIKELEKYNIYLLTRDAIEKNITDPNLFNGVKVQQEELNINTLDNYSLSDIRTIQSNLRKIEKYSQCFPDGPKLKRKLGK